MTTLGKPVVVYDETSSATKWSGAIGSRPVEKIDLPSCSSAPGSDEVIRLSPLLSSLLLCPQNTPSNAPTNVSNNGSLSRWDIALAFAKIHRPFAGSMSKRMHLTCATRKNCARPCESAGLGHACNSETSVRSAITAGLQKDPGICWETNREPLLEGLLLAIQQQKLEWPGKVLVQPLPTPARADVESWWKDNKALAQLLWLDAMGFLLSMPQPPRELGAGAELETELRKLQVDEAHRGKLQKVFERLVLTHVLLRHGLTAQQRIAALVNRGERVMIVLPEELGDDQRTRVLDALLLGVPTRFNPISAEELGPLDDEIGIPDYAAVPPAETQETTAMTIEFLELGDPRIGDFIDDTGAGAPVWVHAADPSALQSAHLRGMKESRVLRISQDVIKDLASAKQRIPTLGSELESRRSTQG